MEELEKNGLSMEVLEQLAYETQMEKSLKNTLHKFDEEKIFQEISDIIEFYQDCHILDDIALDYTNKEHGFMRKEISKILSKYADYQCLLNDELPQGMRLVNMSTGKARNDGYRGIHLYYQPSHRVYPIEIQVNTFYDTTVKSLAA